MSPVANNNVAGESAFRDVKSSRFSSSYALSPDSSHSFCDNGTPRNTGIFDYQAIERQRMQEFCNAIEDMAGWSVDGVCDFLREIGCKEYEKVGSAANCACFLHVYSLGFERLYYKR